MGYIPDLLSYALTEIKLELIKEYSVHRAQLQPLQHLTVPYEGTF